MRYDFIFYKTKFYVSLLISVWIISTDMQPSAVLAKTFIIIKVSLAKDV